MSEVNTARVKKSGGHVTLPVLFSSDQWNKPVPMPEDRQTDTKHATVCWKKLPAVLYMYTVGVGALAWGMQSEKCVFLALVDIYTVTVSPEAKVIYIVGQNFC